MPDEQAEAEAEAEAQAVADGVESQSQQALPARVGSCRKAPLHRG
jgi:hypothetical protein